MSKPIADNIRVEPIWDPRSQCRKFQVIVVNRTKGETFTVQKDIMARDYLKLKLSDAEIMQLITELHKAIGSVDFDPTIVHARFGRSHLSLVKDDNGGEGNDAG